MSAGYARALSLLRLRGHTYLYDNNNNNRVNYITVVFLFFSASICIILYCEHTTITVRVYERYDNEETMRKPLRDLTVLLFSRQTFKGG